MLCTCMFKWAHVISLYFILCTFHIKGPFAFINNLCEIFVQIATLSQRFASLQSLQGPRSYSQWIFVIYYFNFLKDKTSSPISDCPRPRKWPRAGGGHHVLQIRRQRQPRHHLGPRGRGGRGQREPRQRGGARSRDQGPGGLRQISLHIFPGGN